MPVNSSPFRKVFVCRVTARFMEGDTTRGILLPPSLLQEVQPRGDYRGYYSQTIAKGILPDSFVLEFGQFPTISRHFEIERGDLVVLLVGSDSPGGSSNERGIIGLAEVQEADSIGTGATGRGTLLVKTILHLSSLLSNNKMKQSPFYEKSGVKDIKIFGLEGSPAAQNCVRFFKASDEPERIKERFECLLGMCEEVDSNIRVKLEQTRPDLAEMIPETPPSVQVVTTNHTTKLKQSQEDAIVRADVIIALCSKPFLILTGPSGTGKTREFIKMASFIDYALEDDYLKSESRPANMLALVAVGADWNDIRSLTGYKNPFGEPRIDIKGEKTNTTYEVTDAIRLMLRASHPNFHTHPHILLLDEMNLSHVERYFSTFLSIMEADRSIENSGFELISRSNLSLIAEVLAQESPLESESAQLLVEEGRGLGLPGNVFIVGTVNIDETTYMFSPKVLDRAHVIEFNPDSPSDYLNGTSSFETLAAGTALQSMKNSVAERVHTKTKAPIDYLYGVVGEEYGAPLVEQIKSVLDGLFILLRPVGFAFGPRAINEVFVYVTTWLRIHKGGAVSYRPEIEDDDLNERQFAEVNDDFTFNWILALDRAILQKLLPKIHGNKREIGGALSALIEFLEGKPARYQNGGAAPVVIDRGTGLNLKMSSEKVQRMKQTLDAKGYTSFI